ncbi:hypothetical protein PR202_ga10628 [Eleusine coracana subsp. coracana]|uniref:DUF1618 domain-containing protein n=1 Tax=Eleusine coracana subsp. coracana TaxID=191504 RepID=A0AAV5C771_ELECO|nr:hypothetical protein QOZ80_1AG0023030 [Eleusine coracana subsp. coracana]GJM94017.1 hypothetical protein PR202_ga10628 [Eleusine coracana subsp. coracana]
MMEEQQTMEAVLLDRYVRFVDEVSEIIAERGGSPPSLTMESILQGIPENLSWQEREAAVQRTMEEAMSRYREEIEAPAEAILRERKASRPSAVKKIPVAFGGNDAALYREALDGIEPEYPQLVGPPGITSMVLRVSWSRASALRSFPPIAFVSSVHHNILVLYVGDYRPGFSSRGFYLVYDAMANSVAMVPRLPTRCVTMFSHCGMGSGVTVLRYGRSQYLLAELLLRKEDHGLTSNKATLFRWWSSEASGWVQTEVVLPLPCEPDEHTSEVNYSFYVDTFFAIGNTCLCWADLLEGMLVCYVLADCPKFRFVPLPEGCSKLDPCQHRGLPDQYRSMSCVERGDDQIITFVSMDGYGQGRHISNVELTTWTLKNPSDLKAKWTKGTASFRIRDLWSDRFYKENLLLGQLTPTFPVLSTTGFSWWMTLRWMF